MMTSVHSPLPDPTDPVPGFRRPNAALLEQWMLESRQITLGFLDTVRDCRSVWSTAPEMHPQINPPIWELGHVAWFEEYWITRNTARHMGVRIPTELDRPASIWPDADPLFDSSRIAQSARGCLVFDDLDTIRDYLMQSHERARRCLRDDAPLRASECYFFQLALAHEWMHQESLRMNAQMLGLNLSDRQTLDSFEAIAQPVAVTQQRIRIDRLAFTVPIRVADVDEEFFFDNELPIVSHQVSDLEIDHSPVTHGAFFEFMRAGGYARQDLWTPQGWAWRTAHQGGGPQMLRSGEHGLERQWFGEWRAIHPDSPMIHVSLHEAQAWCRWAGRCLPTESEWLAGCQAGMEWGRIWEWTADSFQPHDGFASHPYRDYSAPWFGSHQLVKGCSIYTHPALKSERYRNFFQAQRADAAVGFRTVAPRGRVSA